MHKIKQALYENINYGPRTSIITQSYDFDLSFFLILIYPSYIFKAIRFDCLIILYLKIC